MPVRTFALALTAFAISGMEAGAQPPAREPAVPERPRAERTIICRGAAIPDGWILVDDTRSTEMCGGSNPAVVNLYNVWAIERYDSKPVGATMEVCAAAPTPPGWVLEDLFRAKDRCGHPENAFIANVKRIRRVR